MRQIVIITAGAALGLGALTAQGQAPEAGVQAQAVESSLEQSGDVTADAIEVRRISEHAVELTGTVGSDAEKQRASVVAQQTEGVDFVRNELDVEGG